MGIKLKNISLIIFLFLIHTQNGFGQLFPKIGDSLSIIKTQLRSVPGEDLYGENNIWNYLFLDAPYVEDLLFMNPSLGSAKDFFNDAEILSVGANGDERYYKESKGKIIEVGRFGSYNWFLGNKYLIQYQTSPIIKKNDYKLNDRYKDFTSFYISMDVEDLESLGIEITPMLTDKVRFNFEIDKTVILDSKGDLLLPFGNYKVMRTREEVEVECKITIPSNLGWKELPSRHIIRNDGKVQTGKVNLTNFYYWTADQGYPILSIEQIEEGLYDVVYLNEDASSNVPRLSNKEKDVIAFPNPTFGEITFKLQNYPAGIYNLQIYDIVNKLKYSEKFNVRDNGKMETNLGFLIEGTYLYSIIDERGEKLTTKRVVIIRP